MNPSSHHDHYNNNTKSQQSLLEIRFQQALDKRRQCSTLRSLCSSNISSSRSSTTATTIHNAAKQRIDFSTNDYLGLAHSKPQLDKVNRRYERLVQDALTSTTANQLFPYLGSTGSRLLSGNSRQASDLEEKLARIHSSSATNANANTDTTTSATTALLCNSGYDANLSLLSSIPTDNDYILMDELIHNSLIMGVRMSRIPLEQIMMFRHNDVNDLQTKLGLISQIVHERNRMKKESRRRSGGSGSESESESESESGSGSGRNSTTRPAAIIVVVESVYSMDGDIAPLKDILDVAYEYNASVIVDEAHGLGVFGKTNVHNIRQEDVTAHTRRDDNKNGGADVSIHTTTGGGTGCLAALHLETHPALLAAVYTFGKAAGCHGAVIITKNIVKQYLINYARPFIYSTALPPHSLCTIECAYETMIGMEGELLRQRVFELVDFFRESFVNEFKVVFGLEDDKEDYFHNTILLKSYSPIQAVMCRGNEHCIRVANMLRKKGSFDVFPIRSPTVPKGEERIRIIIHAHNSEEEVLDLVRCMSRYMMESLKFEARTMTLQQRQNRSKL